MELGPCASGGDCDDGSEGSAMRPQGLAACTELRLASPSFTTVAGDAARRASLVEG